jgi:hypothetical protein
MLVVMNADNSSDVQATLQFGFSVPILDWLPYLLVPSGVVLCLGGWFLLRRRKTAN